MARRLTLAATLGAAAAAGGCPNGADADADGSCPAPRLARSVDSSLLQRTVAHTTLDAPVSPEKDVNAFAKGSKVHEYDCDEDGINDCGRWDYSMGMCRHQAMCGHFYKFPDASLDMSCRCRKCPLFDDGTAFGDEKMRNPWELNALGWGFYRNWADHMDTCAPWIMPRNDEALRNVLTYAKHKGYKVRISGAAHSAGGIVTDGKNSQVIVMSLGEYQSPEEWEFKFQEMPDGSARAWANAGWTQFHLYEKVRPLDYFLPAQTAGYFFHLGGIVANSVHGGSYHAGFIHSYAVRLRVMLHDGTIKIIDKEEEMRMWRCSFGLLGFILNIEFQLEKREKLQMYAVREKMSEWSSEEFWRFIKQSAEADLPDSLVPKDGGVGSKKSWNGEYFLDFRNGGEGPPSIMVYAQKANNSVDANFTGETGRPANLVENYAKLRNKKVSEDGRGMMSWAEAARRDGSPPIKILGVEVNDILGGLKSLDVMANAMSDAAMDSIVRMPTNSAKLYNDGFFLTYAPAALAGAFFVKPEKAFASMDFLRKVQIESKTNPDFIWNLPGEFRFVNVQDSATLQPIEPGMWFNCQMISFADLAKNAQGWKKEFARVEANWVNELGAKPHMGKLFGFEQHPDGMVEPFGDSYSSCIYSDKQKASFEAYRKQQDPEGLFATGLGMKFLEPCTK